MTQDYRARKAGNSAAWRARNPGLTESSAYPFCGVDGEGGTTVTGSHDYFLLRAGEFRLSRTDGPLSSADCLEFLSGLPPRRIYVAYFFDYDTTKICQDLGWGKLWRLIHREERAPRKDSRMSACFPVDVHGGLYQIDYLPRKYFKVRKRLREADESQLVHAHYGHWVEISDVGTFFQCSFMETITRWDIGTPEGREAIGKGKAHRSEFDARDLADIDKYNDLECRYLAELMEKFRATCRRSGYVPRKWQGPGQVAEAMMKARGIPKSAKVSMLTDPANERLLSFAARSFYGGRPEITLLGPVGGPVWQADINSAYPYALTHVPCLEHGEWTHETQSARIPKWPDMGLVYGHFTRKSGTKARLFGLPVRRDNGSIYYPGEAKGWYWSFEICASVHQMFAPEEVFHYRKRCDCIPFGFVPDLYAMRLRLGKDALGLYLKLALNSLYGKTAQSIGNPVYANPIWASFITAYTRAQVQGLIHKMPSHKRGECGRDVAMVATDAIFTTAPPPVRSDKTLGGWSVEEHPNGLLIIQPGLYFRGNGEKPKTRGVPKSAVAEREQEFIDAWERMCETGDENKGVVDIPVHVFIGLRQALHRRKLDLAGTWIEYREDGTIHGKRVGYEWRTKRAVLKPPVFRGPAETFPYPGTPDTETVPYSREIGAWRTALRLDFEDQPDWAPVLGMPDND